MECVPYGSDGDCDCWWANNTRMHDVLNLGLLAKHDTLRQFGAPYHVAFRPGVQSSHLTERYVP